MNEVPVAYDKSELEVAADKLSDVTKVLAERSQVLAGAQIGLDVAMNAYDEALAEHQKALEHYNQLVRMSDPRNRPVPSKGY
jgi:hypothetical protein